VPLVNIVAVWATPEVADLASRPRDLALATGPAPAVLKLAATAEPEVDRV